LNPNNTPNNQEGRLDSIKEATMKIIKFASVLIAIAIVAACYSYTKIEDAFSQLIVYSVSGGLCMIATLLISISISVRRSQKNRRNFFLYDKKKKSEIAPEELTFDTVRRRICDFMSIFKHRGKLYVGDLFSENATVPEHFKPLFCYELLYELATDDGLEAGVFLSFGSECADVFAKYLRENEDYDLANKIYGYIVDFESGNKRIAEFKEYMSSMGDHISSKMLGYAKDNIEKFN